MALRTTVFVRNVYWDHGDDAIRRPLYHVCKPSNTSSGNLQGIETRPGYSCCGQYISDKPFKDIGYGIASLLGMAKDGILLFELDQLDKKNLAHVAPSM